MCTPCRFDDKEYINWLKCSLAFIHFKESLHDFIKTEVSNFHVHIQQKIATIPCGSSVGSQCGFCTWKSIKHTGGQQGIWYINCQNRICDKWLSEILLKHNDPKNRAINWKNADISKWPTSGYEVAKVYMPKGQDKTKNLPNDFDAPAILSLLKYCTWFSQNVQATSIISDLIEMRNEVMHSGDLRVADSKKNSCIDKMIQLLSQLNIHGDVCTELQKTKREDININFQEAEVKALQSLVSSIKGKMDSLHDAQTQQMHDVKEVKDNTTETAGKMVTMESDIQGVKSDIEQLTEIYRKIKSFLVNNPDIDDKNISENIQAIEKKYQEIVTKITLIGRDLSRIKKGIKRKLKDTEEKIEEKHQEIETKITSMGRDMKGIKKGIKKKLKETEEKHQAIETKITSMGRDMSNAKNGIKTKFSEIDEKTEKKHPTVPEDMQSLHNELLHRYKSLRTIPFSPIDEQEVPVPLEYFYTEVVIKCEDKENTYANRSSTKERRMEKETQQEKKLTSYKQIFERSKRTVLTGLSGSGKSTFCRKIVNTWCKLQEKRKTGISTDVEGSSTHDSSNVAGPSAYDTSHTTGLSVYNTSIMTGSSTLDSSNVAGPSTHDSTNVINHENVLLKFDLLFYINSPAISNETKLTNVLCNQCIKREQKREKDEIQNKLSKLLNDHAENILIIFDGLDEMGHTPKFLVDLFKRDLYPGISVLMGMRPWRISRLDLKPLSHYDLLLDIQGFSTDNALEFVQKVFDMNSRMYGETKEKSISKKDREILTSFKNIPLLLLFLAHIWYREESLPDKYKDLYNQIIDFLSRRWVKKAGNKCTVIMSDKKNMDLLLRKFQETHFSSACKVAYHFLLERKNGQSVVIPQKELVRKLGENSDVKLNTLLHCGIMSKVDSFSPLEKNVSVTFLHMSIQEYLASIYLVQDEDAFQKFLRSIVKLNDVLRYENLLIFISGLDASRSHKAFIRICEVCDEDTLVIQYREKWDNDPVIRNLNDMYIKCVNELNEQELVEMPDIIIIPDTDYKLLMPRLRSSCIKSLLVASITFDELDLSALVSLTSLKLEAVTMSEECSISLCSSIKGCSLLENLCLEDIILHDGVLDMSYLTNLIHLAVFNVTLSGECSRSLCSSISGCTHLEKLHLEYIELHDGVLDLSSLTNMIHLRLDAVAMSEECSRSLCSSIISCTRLIQMKLKNTSVNDGALDLNSLTNLTKSEECSRSLCRSISGCIHMEKLHLEYINLRDGVLDLRSLTNLTKLILLHVSMSEECSRSLCRSISGCIDIEKLHLEYINLHDGVLDLRSLTNLTKLILLHVSMSEECSRSLCTSISSCTHLNMKLENILLHDLRSLTNPTNCTLDHVTISEECRSISGHTYLENLHLEYIKLHDGVLNLSSLTNLIFLRLDDVTMSEECSRSLCSSISSCTCLCELYLKDIPLYDGVLALRSLTNLIFLTLDDVTMSEECSRSMCSSINSCTRLIEMKLKNISLHNAVLDLRTLSNLHYLTLDNATMLKECSISLCRSISSCTNLLELDLQNITVDDGELGNMSRECRRILNLSLKHCHRLVLCDIDSDTDSDSDYEDDSCLT